MQKMNITVLCKVVDNYGDIGVVWRMSKLMKKKYPECDVNLIVDDLSSFKKIWDSVQTEKTLQIIENVNVYKWSENDYCYQEFSQNDGEKLQVILECFQCGRPEWMEKILFEDKLQRIVQIIMIDYLTAEKYAEDFHCLKSLTRSAKVQKVNFMPGFTSKTGGLVIDDDWKNLTERNSNGPVLLFTYEKDWIPLAKASKKYSEKKNNVEFLLAQGRGCESLKNAFSKSCEKYKVLDYVNQNEWDSLMKQSSVLIIRGEESMSRACLSGIPFIWHAYPQSDEYQLVKVNALLEQMSEYFTKEDFEVIKKAWLCINSPDNKEKKEENEKCYYDFYENVERLTEGYRKFALDLRKNGDLCDNLMTFIKKITII